MIDELYRDRIDSRIIEICEEAEKNYCLNKSSQINNKQNHLDVQESNFNQKSTPEKEDQAIEMMKYQTLPSTQRSQAFNEIEVPPTQIDNLSQYSTNPIEKHQSINRGFNTTRQAKTKKPLNQGNKAPVSSPKLIEISKENIIDINKSIQMKSSRYSNPFNLSYNSINSLNTTTNRHKVLSKHSCISCDLQSKIENKSIYHLDLNKKITVNKNINEILLKSKMNISNKKFNIAYDQLHPLIVQGLYHSDLFYLYGEVCRLIKRMEEAEDYLLLCLNFEHHSPDAYYSLGLLYQEVSQLSYSNRFFKKFNTEIETAEIHFQLAKNYFSMKKYLKSADQCTKAIIINPNCVNYYLLRSEVYYKIGLDDMAKEDINKMQGITPKKRA